MFYDIQKITELSLGVDQHLKKLESFIPLLKDIKASLDKMVEFQQDKYLHELKNVKAELLAVNDTLKKRGLPDIKLSEKQFLELKGEFLSEQWPVAVDSASICNTDELAKQRAKVNVSLVVSEHLKGKRFLDYGCGNGHTIRKVLEDEAALAIGYDISPTGVIANVTKNFEEVQKSAPYDVILVYDVLDHIKEIDPIEALKQVRSVLAPFGRVYVVNHPWSSRHGGHLFQQVNKAFAHLIFDDVELTRLGGYKSDHNVKVVTPLETYRHWFEESGFKIIRETPICDAVENFFLKPSLVNERLRVHFPTEEQLENNIKISFVEYLVGHSHEQVI